MQVARKPRRDQTAAPLTDAERRAERRRTRDLVVWALWRREIKPADIAPIMGLSVARVYQILDRVEPVTDIFAHIFSHRDLSDDD